MDVRDGLIRSRISRRRGTAFAACPLLSGKKIGMIDCRRDPCCQPALRPHAAVTHAGSKSRKLPILRHGTMSANSLPSPYPNVRPHVCSTLWRGQTSVMRAHFCARNQRDDSGQVWQIPAEREVQALSGGIAPSLQSVLIHAHEDIRLQQRTNRHRSSPSSPQVPVPVQQTPTRLPQACASRPSRGRLGVQGVHERV